MLNVSQGIIKIMFLQKKTALNAVKCPLDAIKHDQSQKGHSKYETPIQEL